MRRRIEMPEDNDEDNIFFRGKVYDKLQDDLKSEEVKAEEELRKWLSEQHSDYLLLISMMSDDEIYGLGEDPDNAISNVPHLRPSYIRELARVAFDTKASIQRRNEYPKSVD
jgi:hypothetical protein